MTNAPTDELLDLVQRRQDLIAHRERLDNEVDAINARIVTIHGIGATTLANGVKVNVREPNRIFDVDAAMSALTPEQQALAMKVDPAKVKAQIAPALAEAFYKPGKGKCVVTVA